MIRVFATANDQLKEIQNISETKSPWIYLESPSDFEIEQVVALTGLSPDFLRAALDEEEQPRLDFDEGQMLVIINVPIKRGGILFDTIPLGIIITDNYLVTVCLERNEAVDTLMANRPRGLHTAKRSRFLLQALYVTANQYLKYLRLIERKKDEIEAALMRSMKNKELIDLLTLSKGLIYFTTSLRSNQVVMDKLLRSQLRKNVTDNDVPTILRLFPEDEDLLEDVITENKQAIEMGDVYSSTLNSTMDAFASVISNNLNIVMKFLTSVTIVMAIPTIVASFYGMNVILPGQNSPWAFTGIILASFVLAGGAAWALARRRMF